MQTYAHSVLTLARKPSAALPFTMSLGALAVVSTTLAIYGARHGADEGASAHIFQLLIGLQLPLLAFFAFKWLRSDPRAGLSVLALNGAAIAAALFPVWWFGL